MFSASLILFSPARYIELLWGFEFVLALSIAFSVWGLYVLSGGRAEDGEAAFARRLAWSLLLFTLSVMSSAGGYFGFLAALPVIAIRRIRIRWKIAAVCTSLLAAYGFYSLAVQPETGRHFEGEAFLQALTFAGAALLSSPTAIDDFSLHEWSILGGVVLLLSTLTIVYAARMRLLEEAAFAIGLIAYGILAVAAISVNRAYAANWHIQHILPAFAGTIGLAWLLWKRTARRSAAGLCAAVVLTTSVGAYGWYYGFKAGGPEFQGYAQEIEHYIRTFDRDPGQPAPFPPMGPWVMTHELTAFLRAVEHPVLAPEPR